ncbi:DUF6318 family protein [Demequina phytophila]|uniref:DUF6318 family protein n=1 Tax=Demequina phytophila TaxID=1638981 RepID=UPI0007846E64|nr:DUF6318 family protein [Demequina phytophila]
MGGIHGGRVARGALAAAVTAGLCAALAGCTADAEPIVTESPTVVAVESPSPSASPSPSPSATALTNDELLAMMPEGAERSDVYGAMMTATFFLEQYAPMFQTGDTRVWEALSAEGCEYCAKGIENAERVRDEGWLYEGGEIVVEDRQTQGSMTGDDTATVLLETRLSKAEVTQSDGTTTRVGRPGGVTYGVRLVLVADQWLIGGVASEDS